MGEAGACEIYFGIETSIHRCSDSDYGRKGSCIIRAGCLALEADTVLVWEFPYVENKLVEHAPMTISQSGQADRVVVALTRRIEAQFCGRRACFLRC